MQFYSVCGLRGVAMTKHRTDGLIDGLKKNIIPSMNDTECGTSTDTECGTITFNGVLPP